MAAEQTERQDGPCSRLANVNKIVRPRGRDWLDLSSPHSSNWTKRCQRYRATMWLHGRKLECVQLDWKPHRGLDRGAVYDISILRFWKVVCPCPPTEPSRRKRGGMVSLPVRIMPVDGQRGGSRFWLLSPPQSDFAVDRSLLIIARAAGDLPRQLCCDDKA